MGDRVISFEDRQRVRAARDHQKRQAIAEARGQRFCIGCGGDHDNVTTGCAPCQDRARARERRSA